MKLFFGALFVFFDLIFLFPRFAILVSRELLQYGQFKIGELIDHIQLNPVIRALARAKLMVSAA